VTSYIVRRLLIGVLTLWVITAIVFGLIRSMPGDPTLILLGSQNESGAHAQILAKQIADMRHAYGLDLPWYEGYWKWFVGLLHGDLGRSIYDQKLVTERIGERMGPTLMLSLPALFIGYLLAIPMGLYVTARNGKWQEQAISTFLYVLYALPSFVLALFMLLLFSVKLRWLPSGGMTSDPEVYAALSAPGKLGDRLLHMVLPLVCFMYGGFAYDVRFIKSNMLEVIRQDYVRTGRAKGLSESTVFYKHAFRNTLIPLVTILGLSLPGLLGGAVFIEQIFSWPGMGHLFFEAMSQRDYPVIMGLTLTFSTLVLLGTLLSDILYAVVDPRITYS
jgi:peptide/nickel transport system permease protein